MKSRLNLSIDKSLLPKIKSYADEKQVSISELVEDYFEQLTKPAKKPAFLDIVKNMNVPEDTNKGVDLKRKFFEDNAAKYGF